MPLYNRTNNRVLPANSRAVDVAKRTIRDIIPVQQRRYANAFEVQGYETIVYQRLWHGTACSCQNHRGTSASYLDQEGKLDTGTMDTLLSGGLPFSVNRYASRQPTPPAEDTAQDGRTKLSRDPVGRKTFVIADDELNDPYADDVGDGLQGANGTANDSDLDDASEIFDGDSFLNDTKCGICFGNGYVGGFAVLNGYRKVLHTNSVELTALNGTREFNKVPHAFMCESVEFRIMLPKGAISLDTFGIWNNDVRVYPSGILIDGLPYSDALLLALCDGREHALSMSFDKLPGGFLQYFTHVELQLNLSRTKALFELPRMGQGTNDALQDATNDLSINASPAIPMLKKGDVLVESTFGKALIVGACNPWNDKDRNILGWDVDTRVIQPSELLNHLPRRQLLDQKATYMIRDNMSGNRRT